MKAFLFTLLLLTFSGQALAAGSVEHPTYDDWTFTGVFGTYDDMQLQRGFQVYKEVCASCHSMNLLSYRNLADMGYNEEEIKAIAGEYTVINKTPNDDGEMFERAALPSDTFAAPYPNEKAARAANGGAYPVDMSLIAKARPDGANYIRALLNGYKDKVPANYEVPEGMYYNAYFAGKMIAMPNPLGDGFITYADGSPETLDQYAADVSAFLQWAAEPKLEARKKTGLRVMVFLLILTGLFYALKKKIWADLKK